MVCSKPTLFQSEQLTFEPYHHNLDNNLNFSPDSKWLVYDTRDHERGIGDTRRIEKVNLNVGNKLVLYDAPDYVASQGPGVAAASYFLQSDSALETLTGWGNSNRIIFIHGPRTESGLAYAKARRFGAIIPDDGSAQMIIADARDVVQPFTPGALRGGTHRHEPLPGDGKWIGFTYNDFVMKEYGDRIGKHLDLRTIGVTRLGHPVAVEPDARGENWSGIGFSALVVKVVPEPKPDADEISNAAGDSWIGWNGYLKPDGTRQLARAFIGTLANGHSEVFIVDIPDDITLAGSEGPLEGTATSFPMPPRGTVQRRLTTTKIGCMGVVRSHPDGRFLCYRSGDANGDWQLFLIPPQGGKPSQLTAVDGGVATEGRWRPDGEFIVFAARKRICIVGADPQKESFMRVKPLTQELSDEPENIIWSPDRRTIAFNMLIDGFQQIFILHPLPDELL
ncbi:DUF3748 domain-containing protein [candidate division KSB1 bacterium]|nr:DUF3748 domain-containing protein [candidate division KSB1 bacterium]